MNIPYEKIVAEDLNTGYGTVSVTMPAGGVATGNKIGLHTLNGVFNVKNFGAIGDGTTNDAVAIQAAIDLAATGTVYSGSRGVHVFFPAGTYRVNSKITLKPGVRISGAGQSATVIFSYVSDDDLFYFDADTAALDSVNTIQIGDLSIVGKIASTGSYIRLTGTTRFSIPTISNVYVFGGDLGTYGLRIDNTIQGHCSVVRVQNCTSHGFFFESTNNLPVFTSTYAIGNGGDGYNLAATQCTMNSPGADSNTGNGYYFDACAGVTLNSMEAENNGPSIATFYQCSGVVVNAAAVYGSGLSTDGIIVNGCTGVFLNNPTIAVAGTGTPSGYNLKLLNTIFELTLWHPSYVTFTSGTVSNAGSSAYVSVSASDYLTVTSLTVPAMTPGGITGLYAGAVTLVRSFQAAVGAGGQSVGKNIFVGGAGNSTMTNGAGATDLASNNVAVGSGAFLGNTTGYRNVAIGDTALGSNTTGLLNTAVGYTALYGNTDGFGNSAIGGAALIGNTTGDYNVGVGTYALLSNSTGNNNVAIGYFAGAYETGSSAFYVDNQNRTNTAGDKAGALLYGTFNATAANQTLQINAKVTIGVTIPAFVASDKYLVVDSSGNVHVSATGPAS
jgi:hypothetical protein